MDKSVHDGHRTRMRERFFENGFDGFSEHEILEMLLYFTIPRRNTNEIAHDILDEYMTLANVFDADPQSLMDITGLKETSATLLTMIPHLFRVYETSKYTKQNLLHNTESIGQFAVSLFKDKVNEEFALICLDSNRRVHWSGIIKTGEIDRIDAHPRRVMGEVIKHNAKTVIFAHNHPHGSLMPSVADKEATRQLTDLLRGIDVTVLDHIIVSGNRFYSMAEMGFTF